VHLGATRVLLLGYDMQRTNGKDHYHADHPYRMANPYTSWQRLYRTLAPEIAAAGVTVINCSRETALTCFPRQSIAEALADETEAVA
jgi:hypothetical protein